MALFKGLTSSGRSDPAIGDTPNALTPQDAPVWTQVALRRDGLRPFCVEAMLIHIYEDIPDVAFSGHLVPVRRSVSLYITRAKEVLVHVYHQPPEGCPARSVYRVLQPRTAQEMSESIWKYGPELCFAVSAQSASCKDTHLFAPFGLARWGTVSATS